MDDKAPDTRRRNTRQELGQYLLRNLIINADPAFDRNLNIHSRAHGRAAFSHKPGFAHQYSAKATRVYPVRGASNIQDEFIISCLSAQFGSLCQFSRVRAPQLQRHRMFGRMVIEQIQGPSAHQCRRRDHFGIEQRILAQ